MRNSDQSLRLKCTLTKNKEIGLVDADLLCKGTRHPNLVLLKLAGFFKSKGYHYRLITNLDADLEEYSCVYLSRVFTFTELPEFVEKFCKRHPKSWHKHLKMGGTGFYATENDPIKFIEKRNKDMCQLEEDEFLKGFSMAHQMPDYTLYNDYVSEEIKKRTDICIDAYRKKNKEEPTLKIIDGFKSKSRMYFKDYLDYSIGFLTRGCIRGCPFCINKNERKILPYSQLNDFVDNDRPYIYLWDDNFLNYPGWKELLQALIDTGKPFQFRQGLDERRLDKEQCEMLSRARYHGDFIFAFDQWKDRKIIEKKLKIWRKYNPSCTTKFYLFCGYELTETDDEKFYTDVYLLFKRIEILMRYACLGYVMRHADYEKHPLGNIYTQIARWCNQPQFFKKMSFVEFVERNQTYKEEKSPQSKRICKTVLTYNAFKEKFLHHWDEIEPLFKMKFEETVDKSKWE